MLKESLQILWRALGVFMLASPPDVSLATVREALLDIPGVEGVHHLHLWQVSEHDTHFEGHITIVDQPVSETAGIRAIVEALLADRFDINHVTLQIEEQQTTCSTVDLP